MSRVRRDGCILKSDLKASPRSKPHVLLLDPCLPGFRETLPASTSEKSTDVRPQETRCRNRWGEVGGLTRRCVRAQRPQPASLNPLAAPGKAAPRHSHPGQAQSTGPGDPELIQHTQALTKPCQGVSAAPTHPCAQSSCTRGSQEPTPKALGRLPPPQRPRWQWGL